MNICIHPDCEEEGRNRRFVNDQIHFFCNTHVDEYEEQREKQIPNWKNEDDVIFE